jgi:ferredoxin
MKLRIDNEACTGHGRCYVLAPDVFEPDDEGHSVALVVDIPAELLDKAQLAVANCPESAITIVDN